MPRLHSIRPLVVMPGLVVARPYHPALLQARSLTRPDQELDGPYRQPTAASCVRYCCVFGPALKRLARV